MSTLSHIQNENNTLLKRVIVALSAFLVASVFGVMMRYAFVGELEWFTYKNILHAHSHTALMGWAFTALSSVFLWIFTRQIENSVAARTLFGLNAVAVAVMSISFLLQGYSILSIVMSTLHLLCVYVFGFVFLKHTKDLRSSSSMKLARWAVIWLLFSTIGLWSVGPAGILLGKLHPLYFMSVQFFLHFQFNGWFAYGILAIFFQLAEQSGKVSIHTNVIRTLHASVLLTYAQSVTWSSPSDGLFYLNTFGVLLQVLAYALILRSLIPVLVQTLSKVAVFPGWLVKLAIACLVAKVLVQSAVALPFVAVISYTIRLYVIGFIHLILLGMVTLSMGGVLQLHHILPSGRLTKTGWILLLFGFLLTEMLLFTQGTLIWAGFGFLPNYHYAIFICSLLFPAGISMILTGALLNKTSNHNSFNFNNQVKQ